MNAKFASALMMLASCASANYTKYWSGEVKTKETFTYGRFSTRMRGCGKPGTVGSFFTFWDGPEKEREVGWNEIDVEIVPSVYDNPMSMNIIWEKH